MAKVIQFGETVEGYDMPVLNEREIRAAAGIFFLLMYTALMLILFKGDFLLIKYAIVAFLADFGIRVFVNPQFAPSLIIGRWIVRNQTPEYVGAPQKKVAWIIGVALAAVMFISFIVLNAYSPITGIICLVCLVFLFFESAFGICLGCKFYGMIYKDKAQYCPGEVCDTRSRHEIQKISGAQVLVVVGLVVSMILAVNWFNDSLSETPHDLFGTASAAPAN
jgi:hypothetical protein